MSLNLDIVGTTSEPAERSWTSTDCLLYALGVGAGSAAPDEELEFTTENSTDRPQRVLPTMAAVLGAGGRNRTEIGDFDPAMLLHGEQGIELLGPIPPSGSVLTTSTVTGIYDKGSGALVVTESTSVDTMTGAAPMGLDQRPVHPGGRRVRRGAGAGRGGATDPRGPARPGGRVRHPHRPGPALPAVGRPQPPPLRPRLRPAGRIQRPILHGLCTYGVTGRALLHTLCHSDPGRFRSMHGRFSRPTYPGDTLTVSMWVDGPVAAFRTENQRGEVILDQGVLHFS